MLSQVLRRQVLEMPLAIVQSGRQVRVVAIEAGHGLQGRLANMGSPAWKSGYLVIPCRDPFL